MITGITVKALIDLQASVRPQDLYALATEDPAQRISYADLHASCQRTAAWLLAQGVAAGDTVSLIMPNGLQTLRLLLGSMYAGRCVNPVNLLSQTEQMRYVLTHSDCKLVCVAPEWAERVAEMLKSIDRPIALVVSDPDGADLTLNHSVSATTPTPTPMPTSVALLMYTSGTTGVPKGVMLTQANLTANAMAITAEHGLLPSDRVLGVLPLYHINAFAVTMLAPLAHGGSVAMAPKFSGARFWAQTVENQCTWINVVPTIISYLLEGETPASPSLEHIRFCRSASAALPPEHLRAFEAKFGIGIIETMGLTETVAPSFSNPLTPEKRMLGSVGRASGCEAAVVNAQLQPVADGETGEIVIRGPNVMLGYYKNESATVASFMREGWLRTGDLGHRDSDGFFFITGRIKELIIKGGENIAPREIDEALLKHPHVLEAAAVGIPDKHYGQEIMACVVARDGMVCTEDDLRLFCHEHLGKYKTPKVFKFVTELPRGPSGKVQRLKLLDLV